MTLIFLLGLQTNTTDGMGVGESNIIKDRRCDALMDNFKGSWSGTIGWIDANIFNEVPSDTVPDDDTSTFSFIGAPSTLQLIPRAANRKQNMRLSFYPRSLNPHIADWIVYHARAPGVRQEAIMHKSKDHDPMANLGPKQTFYCFEGGNLGRSGTNFTKLPVIEHGYWDSKEGMRRSVVLAYDAQSGYISKICFLQQKRQIVNNNNFVVEDSNVDDCSVMPEKAQTLEELRLQWGNQDEGDVQSLDCTTGKYADIVVVDAADNTCKKAIGNLLGRNNSSNDDKILQIALPNGVVLACPCCFRTGEKFDIFMGYKRQCGEIQMTEYSFNKFSTLQKVTGRNIRECVNLE